MEVLVLMVVHTHPLNAVRRLGSVSKGHLELPRAVYAALPNECDRHQGQIYQLALERAMR